MNYILLSLTVLGLFLQNIFTKQFNIKNKGVPNGIFVFNLIWSLVVLIFFAVAAKGVFIYNKTTMIMSALFAVSYAGATIFNVLAILHGPLSLSCLVSSYSLIIPSLFGIIYLKEPFKITVILGSILLLVSLLLFNLKNDKNHITLKWAVFAFLAFVGNGMCSSVQKLQQIQLTGLYKNEFMISAMMIVSLINVIALLFAGKEKIGNSLRCGAIFAIPCGIANAVVNLLIMTLATKLPASFMFPVVSAGGIIVTSIAAVTIYKEKLSKMQISGLVVGILSIIILNL